MAAILEQAAGSMDLCSCACLPRHDFGSNWGADEDVRKSWVIQAMAMADADAARDRSGL